MSTLRTHFTFRVDTWTANGESIVEHVAGVEDYQVALRYLLRRLPTLAWHSHHLTAGRASNRGQQALARGVESIKSTTFREEPLGTPASLRSGALVISLWPNEGSRDPAHLTVLGRGSRFGE